MLNQLETPFMGKQEVRPTPLVQCTKCKCEWFEQFTVRRYKAEHTVILSQHVPPAGLEEFVVLRCIGCNEKYSPNVQITAQDNQAKLYNSFMDQLEDKLPDEVNKQ